MLLRTGRQLITSGQFIQSSISSFLHLSKAKILTEQLLLLLRLHGLLEIVPLSLLSRPRLRGPQLVADLPVPE